MSVYCPKCVRNVFNGECHIDFSPIGARLQVDGTFYWGAVGDAYLDYTHMECGTQVRFASNARWDNELGEYTVYMNPDIEITIDGRYVEHPEHGFVGYTTCLEDDSRIWGPTFENMYNLLVEALENLRKG